MAELGHFKNSRKKLHFEKIDFKIYKPDFGDFWEKINFETFYARTIPKRCVLEVF